MPEAGRIIALGERQQGRGGGWGHRSAAFGSDGRLDPFAAL
jgi:hypothetical protein